MKIIKRLLPVLFSLLLVLALSMLCGCSRTDSSDAEEVLKSELDQLKNLDSDTTQKYVSYKEFFPDTTQEIELSKEVKEVFFSFSGILITKSGMLMSTTIQKKPAFPCSFLHWMPGHLPKTMHRHLLKLPF